MNIVLYEPEIPSNTGNIGRTCVATGTVLHLIEPLGFSISEKALRRAGLDYWQKLDVRIYADFREFLAKNFPGGYGYPGVSSSADGGRRIWMATTKAKQIYTEAAFGPDDFIMFGKETAGIPEEVLVEYEETCIRIPMLDEIRSLNLSNSVGIVLYEALRQQGFAGLQNKGELHRMKWRGAP